MPAFRIHPLCLVLLLSALPAIGCASTPSRAGQGAAASSTTGKASWYGKAFAGRRTASGEPFDPSALTAAHRTLAFGTRVRVTHLGNGRSVEVRINDRGPSQAARIIDLSEEAARRLDMVREGVASVRVDVPGR